MDKDRIAGSAKDFAGKVEGAVGDIAGDPKTEASGRAREAASSPKLHGQAKDAARDAADTAMNYAKDAYEKPAETLRGGQEAILKTVQENPLGSLLVAGGIGFALALLLTRPAAPPPPSPGGTVRRHDHSPVIPRCAIALGRRRQVDRGISKFYATLLGRNCGCGAGASPEWLRRSRKKPGPSPIGRLGRRTRR